MNIHEHQAKQILKKYGASVPKGEFAFTINELIEKAKKISSNLPPLKFNFDNSNSYYRGYSKEKKRGIGEEFWEYKKFQLGDPVRNIDWKKSIKSKDIFIKFKEINSKFKNVIFIIKFNIPTFNSTH